ncbi:hypothetical protein AMJ39_05705 [candidate division TA06 bacterium DG_24]|uniref:Putative pyruvate, phosphate dikinase regulatory protein n=3 Tax=Bacteria division TA06 TaxID=1156500 RepID=A0A0S8JIZ0_UNCT6|nr:MAG: hypothetical protein AMJ39_05705 [candidate division TA06 bacterium DG_24]KPK69275.1 MAG: hypothetical protein AMJ82_06015 [candidate division TA06 bacterium SM23_40]KPL09753.1 MAG: hypothetical protein AMJ71_05625 [candidate division TA06 bacterium SM1_40]
MKEKDNRKSVRMRHVFAVSDGTGATIETVVKAALKQFEPTKVELRRIPNVRTSQQVEELVDDAAKLDGIIIYTMVSPKLRRKVTEDGMKNGVPTVDVFGPILTRLSDLLELSPMAKPGIFRQLDEEYFRRIEAVDYTVKHDDGGDPAGLDKAEIILVGVSRTSKTPVAIYLAYRGWKVANIPIILGIKPPRELFEVDSKKVVGMTITADRLTTLRSVRVQYLDRSQFIQYTDPAAIREELRLAEQLFAKQEWPVVDVSHKSIEETATQVMRITYGRSGVSKGEIPVEEGTEP